MAQIDLSNATVYLRDGDSNYIAVKVGEGTFDWHVKQNVDVVDSRGVLDTVRLGNEEAMSISFQFVWEYISAPTSDPPTVENCLNRNGPASSWVSTNPDPDAPYCIDAILQYEPVCSGADIEALLFPQFYPQEVAGSLKDGTVSVSGLCNSVQPVIYHEALIS